MSRRTNARNAFETGLDGSISAGDTTIDLDSAVGLVAPGILTIDPDSPTLREIIEYTGISSNSLTGVTRGLDGSAAGAQAHDNGIKIRSAFEHQFLDKIFDDIEDLEDWDTAHLAAADPHTGYLQESVAATTYAALAGATFTGDVVLPSDPDAALKAATKQYVDAQAAAVGVLPSGARLVFDMDTAPTGWTRDTTTMDDRMIRVVTGARGPNGGTWTQPGHTHTHSANHSHTIATHQHGVANHFHTLSATQTTGSHNHGATAGPSGTYISHDPGTGGTVEIPNPAHTHAQSATGDHSHTLPNTNTTGPGVTNAGGTASTDNAAPGTTDGGATTSSWRPLYRDFILAEKD